MKSKALFTVQAALIAAIYTALTLFAGSVGLAGGAIQLRFSEALTVLPFFTPAAIPGLFIGCVLSNLLTGCVIWDVIFGSLATLIGAVFTRLLRKKHYLLAPVPTIIANTLIIPFILSYAYGAPESIYFLMLTVGIGEILSCGVLGILLMKGIEPVKNRLFSN